MKRETNKKGVSMHLDMIISFSIFIIFVMFLLLYIRPYSRTSFSETMMDNLHEKFGNKVGVDFTKFSLNINYDDSGPVCIDMGKFPININDSGSRVLDEDGDDVDSSNEKGSVNGNLCLNGGDGYYNVYLAKEFSSGTLFGTTNQLTTENYSIGGIENKRYWGNSSLVDIKNNYSASSAGYESVKKELGFPLNMDFAILCLNCNEDYNMTREVPDNSEVFASEYTQMILNQKGEIFEGKFLFKIW